MKTTKNPNGQRTFIATYVGRAKKKIKRIQRRIARRNINNKAYYEG